MGIKEQKNLCGYSHGVAGISLALLELYHVTGNKSFYEGALQGFKYERTHFNREMKNWPDFRQTTPVVQKDRPASYAAAWCHGAPGIGMSRLRAFELLQGDKQTGKEVEEAIQTTSSVLRFPVKNGQGNFSLCHGAGGNADLLIMASDLWNQPDVKEIPEWLGGDKRLK